MTAVARERALIDLDPDAELEELVEMYLAKGLSRASRGRSPPS